MSTPVGRPVTEDAAGEQPDALTAAGRPPAGPEAPDSAFGRAVPPVERAVERGSSAVGDPAERPGWSPTRPADTLDERADTASASAPTRPAPSQPETSAAAVGGDRPVRTSHAPGPAPTHARPGGTDAAGAGPGPSLHTVAGPAPMSMPQEPATGAAATGAEMTEAAASAGSTGPVPVSASTAATRPPGSAPLGAPASATVAAPPIPLTGQDGTARRTATARPTAPARPAGRGRGRGRSGPKQRRARLALRRIDPWSAFVFTLIASLFIGIALVVAVFVLYAVLDSLGVITSLNDLFGEVGGQGVGALITQRRALLAAAVFAALEVVLLTLLATLASLLYNLCATFTGGLELTLGERDG